MFSILRYIIVPIILIQIMKLLFIILYHNNSKLLKVIYEINIYFGIL